MSDKVNDKLVANPQGGYSFLPGLPFLSLAVRAAEGFEIARGVFRSPPKLPDGLDAVEAHLKRIGRPIHALCGLELRFGRQATPQEFAAFNAPYLERIRKANLLIDDRVPLTRANIAESGGDESHRIFAFSYTVPASNGIAKHAPTFVLAAVPEVRNIATKPELVARGDTSEAGMRQKLTFVLDTVESNLKAIGAGWSEVTGVQVYTIYDLHPHMAKLLIPKLGGAGKRGILWHFAQPPVVGGEVEVDVRSTRMEVTID